MIDKKQYVRVYADYACILYYLGDYLASQTMPVKNNHIFTVFKTLIISYLCSQENMRINSIALFEEAINYYGLTTDEFYSGYEWNTIANTLERITLEIFPSFVPYVRNKRFETHEVNVFSASCVEFKIPTSKYQELREPSSRDTRLMALYHANRQN